MKIYTPLVEHLKLQVRFNPKAKAVEIISHNNTVEVSAVQRAAEYVKAFCNGFTCEVKIWKLPFFSQNLLKIYFP